MGVEGGEKHRVPIDLCVHFFSRSFPPVCSLTPLWDLHSEACVCVCVEVFPHGHSVCHSPSHCTACSPRSHKVQMEQQQAQGGTDGFNRDIQWGEVCFHGTCTGGQCRSQPHASRMVATRRISVSLTHGGVPLSACNLCSMIVGVKVCVCVPWNVVANIKKEAGKPPSRAPKHV